MFSLFCIMFRNVFHVAASCGNCDVLEYLYEKSNVSKNSLQSKDTESGWTPLHRAVYYGHIECAVFLYKVIILNLGIILCKIFYFFFIFKLIMIIISRIEAIINPFRMHIKTAIWRKYKIRFSTQLNFESEPKKI